VTRELTYDPAATRKALKESKEQHTVKVTVPAPPRPKREPKRTRTKLP
jgi:hypothetical protein